MPGLQLREPDLMIRHPYPGNTPDKLLPIQSSLQMAVESPLGVCQAPGNRQVPSVLARDLNLGLGTDVFSFR